MTTAPTASAPPASPPPTPSTGRRVLLVLATVVGALLVVAGLDAAARETTTSVRTFDADGIGAIVLDTRAGGVDVTTSDRDDIAVTTRSTAGLLGGSDLALRRDGSRLLLEGDCGGIALLSCSVEFDLQVPRDLAATVDVSTLAGEVRLDGLAHDVDVRATAGTVHLRDFNGATASVATTAGSIHVDAGATTRSLVLETTAGSIDVAIDDREPVRVDADTTVGDQSIALRQDAGAERVVSARTTAGTITVHGR